YLFGVNCGDHMYVHAWNNSSNQGCTFIERLNDGLNSGNWCGAMADQRSAEAIVEFNSGIEPDLADFGPEPFYGVSITDNNAYYRMDKIPHEYFNIYQCTQKGTFCGQWGAEWANTGSINNDPGDNPGDEYTITRTNGY